MSNQFFAMFTGSRDWDDWTPIKRDLMTLPPDTIILVGDATGADEIVRKILLTDEGDPTPFANERALIAEVYEADWDVHGRAAGPIRTLAMLERRPDRVYAYQCDSSRGTQFAITQARRRGIAITLRRRPSR